MKIRLIKNLIYSKILLMIAIDIVVSAILIGSFELESIGGVFAIIYVFLFSIGLYFVVSQLKKLLSIYFKLNIIIAPIILFLLLICSIVISINLKYENKKFSVGNNDYNLSIYKQSGTYEISKIVDHNGSHLNGVIDGTFLRKNDSIFLLGAKDAIKVHKDTLFGFPISKDTILLKD